MVRGDSSCHRRTALATAGAAFTGTIAGCIGSFAADDPGPGDTDQSGAADGSGRCYTEAQSHLADSLGSVENVGVLESEVFVALDEVAADVATYRVFREGSALETFDAGNRSRFAWAAPDAPFETSYRVVLRDDAGDRLGDFEFSAECSTE